MTLTKTAKLGGWEGKISMSADFNEPMDEFEEYDEVEALDEYYTKNSPRVVDPSKNGGFTV